MFTIFCRAGPTLIPSDVPVILQHIYHKISFKLKVWAWSCPSHLVLWPSAIKIGKVNSVQEASTKCFRFTYVLELEILRTTWKNKTKNIKMLDLFVKNWKLRFYFFHAICKISNFDTWTAKPLALTSCTELTLCTRYDTMKIHERLREKWQNNYGKAKIYEHLGFKRLVSFSVFSPHLSHPNCAQSR